MMGAVDKFLFKLENFDKENIPAKVIKALQPYLKVKYSYFISSHAHSLIHSDNGAQVEGHWPMHAKHVLSLALRLINVMCN